MAVRAIDGNALIEWFCPYLHSDEPIPANVVIEDIRSMPTLTQPNEPLTCDGCIALGTSYGPCMNCIRSRLRGDMYRRPPEGEEDT